MCVCMCVCVCRCKYPKIKKSKTPKHQSECGTGFWALFLSSIHSPSSANFHYKLIYMAWYKSHYRLNKIFKSTLRYCFQLLTI